MGFFDRVLGDDRTRAAKYSGPSASETAAKARRSSYWSSGVKKAAKQGQAWEEQDRQKHPSSTRWFRSAR